MTDIIVLAQVDDPQIGAWLLVRNTKTRKLFAVDTAGKRIALKLDEALMVVRTWRDNGDWFSCPEDKFGAALISKTS